MQVSLNGAWSEWRRRVLQDAQVHGSCNGVGTRKTQKKTPPQHNKKTNTTPKKSWSHVSVKMRGRVRPRIITIYRGKLRIMPRAGPAVFVLCHELPGATTAYRGANHGPKKTTGQTNGEEGGSHFEQRNWDNSPCMKGQKKRNILKRIKSQPGRSSMARQWLAGSDRQGKPITLLERIQAEVKKEVDVGKSVEGGELNNGGHPR